MAENEDGQEKSEDATSKRLEDARKKGQVPRSRELNSVALTLLGGVVLLMMSHYLGTGLWQIMQDNFAPTRADVFEPAAMLRHLTKALRDATWLLAPFFTVMTVVAVLASIALGGMNFSAEAMQPKFSKLNPLAGLKRMVSLKGLSELVKSLAKLLLVGGVIIWLLWARKEQILALGYLEMAPALMALHDLVAWAFIWMAAALLLVAAVDIPFQMWEHKSELKMTKQELKEEYKQSDGNPQIKGRIRHMQRELASRRMMGEVPKADVVVTNPNHYAVALRYDQMRMRAPVVTAKGVELVAQNIRRLAAESNVPIVQAPSLARAIYHSTELGRAIPQGLYIAVAKLLAYVFQLKAYKRGGTERPRQPDFPVPADLRWD